MNIVDRALAWMGYERKSNPAYAQYDTAVGYSTLPQPVMMQANPAAFMKEGYRRNDTVHKCVSYIARNAAGIRLALYTDATKKREIESHPLLDLLSKPNKDMSGNDYVESVCAYTLLIGNSYQYALRLAKSGPPDELWSLRPDKMVIVPGSQGIIRYDFAIKEPPTQFTPDLICHTKFWSPDDDIYGLSPIEVAGIFVDMNLAYRKWNLALTQNMAQPPGAWTTPALLGEKERNALEEKVNKKYSGFKNAGKAPVLDGGLKFESYAVPPAQMAFLEGQGANSNSIANIYSLAPQIVGDTGASTFNNLEEAKYSSYTEAIFPLMDKVTGGWNRWLLPMYPDLKKAYLGYDKQSVETIQSVMQAQEAAKADRWTKIWLAGGCKLAEYRDKIGLPPPKQGGDAYRIKDILIAEEDLEEYAEQCLSAPAAPPLPVPEGQPDPNNPDANAVEGSLATPPALPSPKPKKPGVQKPAPKKSLDPTGVYQPDDLDERLAMYEAQGVIETTWHNLIAGKGCDICIVNDGVTVPLGQPFPSGHILPKAHPNCDCFVTPAYGQKREPIDFMAYQPRGEDYKALLRRQRA